MTNVSINDLMAVLQKAGLPFGNSAQMQQIAPFAKDPIRGAILGQDTQTGAIRAKHKAALDRIAAMDQRLGGLYGDPSSPLYIKNPLKREQLKGGATDIGYKDVSSIQNEAETHTSDLESQIDEALKTYKTLTSQQIKEEKATKKKGKVKGKSTKGEIKLTKDQKLAGFADSEAANYFTKVKETDFKRLWIQNLLEGGGIPDDGFTIDDVKKNYISWKKQDDLRKKQEKEAKKTRGNLFH